MTTQEKQFADELRKWWRFSPDQQHTHSWHDREDFIEKMLPKLLSHAKEEERRRVVEILESLRMHPDDGSDTVERIMHNSTLSAAIERVAALTPKV